MKGRAVFLAAIMVFSVVGMSVALSGAAVAESPSAVNDFDDIEGELVYEGQEFNVSDDDIGEENIDITEENTMYLVEVTDTDDGEVDGASTVGSAISVEDDSFDLDLSDLESGPYAVSNRSGSAGSFSLPFDVSIQEPDADWDDDTVTESDDEAELDIDLDRNSDSANYNLTVWAEGEDDFDYDMLEELFLNVNADEDNFNDSVIEDEHFLPLTKLEDRYDIDVEPDDRNDAGENFDELEDEGIITFELNASELGTTDELELLADFENLDDGEGLPDAGDYEFTFMVTDTGAVDTASVEIRDDDVDADFSAGTYDTAAGDIAEFEFELEDTDTTWIQIGDEDSDFVDVLAVEADDEDEPVEVTVNTRLLGTNTSANGDDGLTGEDVYDIENEDGFESGYHDIGGGDFTILPENGANLFGDDDAETDSYGDYIANLSLGVDEPSEFDEQLVRPLQPTDYELQIAGTDVDTDDEPLFDSDVGAGEATDQLDASVLELREVSIGDITTHTAPEENADDIDDDIEELVDAATVRDEIAIEDRLIVQVEATGIYGSLVAGAQEDDYINETLDFDRLDEGFGSEILYNVTETDEQINFDIEAEERSGNQDPLEVDLENQDDSDTFVLIDNDEGQFFVVVDTSSDDAFENGDAPEDDVTFSAELEYDADNDDDRYRFADTEGGAAFDAEDDRENYPYLLVGETLSSSAEFDLAPREISFDNLNADDEVQAENVEDSEISGETNVAPGSDAELRVSSTDASTSFRIGETVDINEDGEISAEYDFSGQEVGDEFDTRFRAGGSSIDTVDSVIVAEGDLGVEDPVEDDEDDVVDDDDDVVEDDDDEVVDDDDDVEEPTDDETPGFGALVALVALIGAALLAVRRQNN